VRRSERKQASSSKLTSKMESLKEMKASRDRQAQEARAQPTPPPRAEAASDVGREAASDKAVAGDSRRVAAHQKESAVLRSAGMSSSDEEGLDEEMPARRARPLDRGPGLSEGGAFSPEEGYDAEPDAFEASAEEVLRMQVPTCTYSSHLSAV
jgi:hypothetical protein